MCVRALLVLAIGLMLALRTESRRVSGSSAPSSGPQRRSLQDSLALSWGEVQHHISPGYSSRRPLLAHSSHRSLLEDSMALRWAEVQHHVTPFYGSQRPLRAHRLHRLLRGDRVVARALLQRADGANLTDVAADAAADTAADTAAGAGAGAGAGDGQVGALLQAAREGNVQEVRRLVDSGVSASARGAGGLTAAHEAAWDCNEELLDYLLEDAGVSPEIATDGGVTLVMQLAMRGCEDELEELVEDFGASIQAVDREGWNALHHAASMGMNEEVVEYLIERGLDVNAATNQGITPFMLAARAGAADVADELIEAGDRSHRDASVVDNLGDNALHFVAMIPEGDAAIFDEQGKVELVRVLVDAGIPVNAVNNRGRTALMYAAHNGLTGVVRALLDAGANGDATDNQGRTAASMARAEGHNDITQILAA